MLTTFEDERSTAKERLEALSRPRPAPASAAAGAALAADTIRPTGALFSAIVMRCRPVRPMRRRTPRRWCRRSSTAARFFTRSPTGRPAAPPRDGMALSGLATSLRTLVEQTHGQHTPIYTAASTVRRSIRLPSAWRRRS